MNVRFLGVLFLCLLVPCLAVPAGAESLKKGEVREYVAAVDPDGVQRVQVIGGSYYFNPNRIVVKLGVPVELTLKKEAGMAPHDFRLKDAEAGLDVTVDLDTKGKTVVVKPTKAGTFPFLCTKKLLFFPSHHQQGMEGVLVVQE